MHGRKEASARNIDNAYVAVGGHIDFDGEPLCSVCMFFFSSRRRHTRFDCDWSSDVCSSDLRASSASAISPRGSSPTFEPTRSSAKASSQQPAPPESRKRKRATRRGGPLVLGSDRKSVV